jgi:hypothetical protein
MKLMAPETMKKTRAAKTPRAIHQSGRERIIGLGERSLFMVAELTLNHGLGGLDWLSLAELDLDRGDPSIQVFARSFPWPLGGGRFFERLRSGRDRLDCYNGFGK